jgi:hypothetical protein
MSSEFDGGTVGRETWSRLGMGVLRVMLLFSSAAVAMALILTPILERRTRDVAVYGVDRMATGSVKAERGHVFTVRRSVLQPAPDAVCVIHEDGARSGAC